MSRPAPQSQWDVIVVGAGVAGAVAAGELARAGAKVLLVDRAAFPRSKVCGGCLSAAGVQLLRQSGWSAALDSLAAPAINCLEWRYGATSAEIDLPPGLAVSRSALDAALVAHARRNGATFWPQCSASPLGCDDKWRTVNLHRDGHDEAVAARLVLACDGLAGSFSSAIRQLRRQVAPNSWMGLGTTLANNTNLSTPRRIRMFCQRQGYAGVVSVENNQTCIAAALDPAFLRQAQSPAQALAQILGQEHTPILQTARWHGTPLLTQRRSLLGDRRLLLLGDAAGYVEPFTGEGMTWSIAAAIRIVPFALAAIQHWPANLADHWTDYHQRLLRRRQDLCRGVAGLLRRPLLVSAAIATLSRIPAAARPIVRMLHGALPQPLIRGVA